MSDIKKDGGPAFPSAYPSPTSTAQLGMSLRDWFAGMALQGTLACPLTMTFRPSEKVLSKVAYDYADAMLKQREL